MTCIESEYDTVRIKNYWESLGKSACPDNNVRDMSIKAISDYLTPNSKVLDLGCGNGYCSFRFAETEIDSILGIDYSRESIKQAKKAIQYYDKTIQQKIQFKPGDALSLSIGDNSFDIVISIRCLINVGDHDKQSKALNEIHRVLKPDGKYLMCENTLSGLERINEVRSIAGLDMIETRWHNNYINDDLFTKSIDDKFRLIKENHFASTYYLMTRVAKAWTCMKNGENPRYDDDFNKMASTLPTVGDFSPMRLYILKKI